jgi:hypothetical protein
MPLDEALACLEHSREELGWARPTDEVPETPEAVMAAARERVDGDMLTLRHWAGPADVKTAIPIRSDGLAVAAFVLASGEESFDAEKVKAMLRLGAGQIEAGLAANGRSRG